MSSMIQRSFAGGELSPAMYARADQVKYATGLRICRNFVVQKHGGVANRAGFRFVTACKNANRRVRLVRFVFNAEQSYVLEFGHLYMRVIRDGVLLETAPGIPYELTTPYDESHLQELQYVQSADVVTIVHRTYPIYELKRYGHTSWTLTAATFVPPIAAPTGGSATAGPSGSKTFTYSVTAVQAVTYKESLPSADITLTSAGTPTASSPHVVSWTAVEGAGEYNVYRAINGVMGFIGVATALSFEDTNITPQTSKTPPQSRNPFDGAGKYPGCVTYFQQRQGFGGSANEPEKIFLSKTGDFHNFTIRSPLQDDDAVTFTMAGRQVNEIRHIIEIGKIVVLTSGGEWTIEGDADGVIKPTALNLHQQGFNGSSTLEPIVVGNTAMFVQARGSIVRDLRYQLASDGYAGQDLTIFAGHLFAGFTITDWAYQQMPGSVVWTVRSDGALLGLTYLPEHEVWGWHRHDTALGVFENVCSIPEGDEDSLYAVVRRTINGSTVRYIERLNTRIVSDVADAFFVDSGLSYNGTPVTSVTGLSHLEGCTVSVLADGSVLAQAVVRSGSVSLGGEYSKVHVGLQITADIGTLDIDDPQRETLADKKKLVNRVTLLVESSRGFRVGQSFDALTEYAERSTEAYGAATALFTGQIEVPLSATWDKNGRVVVRQSDPLPITVLAVIPSGMIGG